MSTGSALVLKTDERVHGIGAPGSRTFVLGFLTETQETIKQMMKN